MQLRNLLGALMALGIALFVGCNVVDDSPTASPNSAQGRIGKETDLQTHGDPRFDMRVLSYGQAHNINEQGIVVGRRMPNGTPPDRAWMWNLRTGEQTEIGSLDGQDAVAFAVNQKGEVAGGAPKYLGVAHSAFLWRDGEFTDLEGAHARDINARGAVVGWSRDPYQGWIWEDGEKTILGTLGGDWTLPFGMNDHNQVVGHSQNADGLRRGFLWTDGIMSGLATLGGDRSQAYAINNRGQVVGRAETSDGEMHAVLWDHGEINDLGTLGGNWSTAFGINDAGQIVGWSRTASGQQHAFLWQRGEMIDLGVPEGDSESFALAINRKGQIAGYSMGAKPHAIIWTMHHRPVSAAGAGR